MTLKNAITMRGHIAQCWLITFRGDPSRVSPLLPRPLEIIEHGGWAYFNVVVSRLTQMRPAPLPAWTGLGYWHAAYRLYARYGDVEGLYFLRSDADSSIMVGAGNLFTDFRFHHARIGARSSPEGLQLWSLAEGARLRVTLTDDAPRLAPRSPFATLDEAAEALRYRPAGPSVRDGQVGVLRITRDERAWRAGLRAFRVEEASFLDPFAPIPEVAYELEPIDYQWNRADWLSERP